MCGPKDLMMGKNVLYSYGYMEEDILQVQGMIFLAMKDAHLQKKAT